MWKTLCSIKSFKNESDCRAVFGTQSTSNMDLFAKIVNGFQTLAIFARNYLRCLTEF